MSLPDFSEYLTGDKLVKEEIDWAKTKHYEKYAETVLTAGLMFNLGVNFTLLELGCGTGWIPTVLPESIVYYGVDKHPGLLDLARTKNNPSRKFVQYDIRMFPNEGLTNIDLVCSFAVLKHFGLHEWEEIFRRMLRLGRYGVFSIQTTRTIGGEAYDDGIDYHHVWVPYSMVNDCVEAEGKCIRRIEELKESGFDTFFYIGDRT